MSSTTTSPVAVICFQPGHRFGAQRPGLFVSDQRHRVDAQPHVVKPETVHQLEVGRINIVGQLCRAAVSAVQLAVLRVPHAQVDAAPQVPGPRKRHLVLRCGTHRHRQQQSNTSQNASPHRHTASTNRYNSTAN
jgi:hypothetical protein